MCTRNDTYLNTLTTSTTEKRTMNAGCVCVNVKDFPKTIDKRFGEVKNFQEYNYRETDVNL